jgi:hypothetical protein
MDFIEKCILAGRATRRVELESILGIDGLWEKG